MVDSSLMIKEIEIPHFSNQRQSSDFQNPLIFHFSIFVFSFFFVDGVIKFMLCKMLNKSRTLLLN